MSNIKTVEWVRENPSSAVPGKVKLVDQTLLPLELKYIETADVKEVWHAIKILQVRGAPAIGVAAAMGLVAAVQDVPAGNTEALISAVRDAAAYLSTSRPTAVNLFWALDRMTAFADAHADIEPGPLKALLAEEAEKIRDEDAAMCFAIGKLGSQFLEDGDTVLTHCNAGGMATAEFGTALAPIYVAHGQGKKIKVFADETRPLLQGSRITAWELMQAGIEVTLICDNMAAHVMKEGKIDAVMVGSDRIAANGDVANKIGTYGVALLAKAHNIPFYVLAPTSTIDSDMPSGEKIPIEERQAEEVTMGFGKRTAPENVKVYSPAFDVTPAELVTAIICEKGVAHPPFKESLAALAAS